MWEQIDCGHKKKKKKENALVGVSENVYWAFLGILKKKKLL